MHTTESSGIDEVQPGLQGCRFPPKRPHHMTVGRRRPRPTGVKFESSRHPEFDDDPAPALESDDELLPTPIHHLDPSAHPKIREVKTTSTPSRRISNHIPATDGRPIDRHVGQGRREVTAYGFDFWELRHGRWGGGRADYTRVSVRSPQPSEPSTGCGPKWRFGWRLDASVRHLDRT